MEATPLLDVQQVSKTYGRTQVLHSVRFSVLPGEVHCLAGENGCGKSTLIKVIAGVVAPDAGAQMVLHGQRYARLTPALTRRLGVQVIYQDLALFPNLSVAQNIGIDAVREGWWPSQSAKAQRAQAQAVLARMGVDLPLDARVQDLGVSQRQLVAIARALASNARVLIMDEPTASLTRHEVDALLGIVQSLQRDGLGLVFVSHRLREVMHLANRVTVLRDGQWVGCFPQADLSERQIAEWMTGQSYHYQPPTPKPAAPALLRLTQLQCAPAVAGVDLELAAGEVLGLVGRLGAGRTELAEMVFGMRQPTGGEMQLAGERYAPRNNREAIAAGVAYLTEDRLGTGLVLDQSIADNITVAVPQPLRHPWGLLNHARSSEWVQRLVAQLRIKVVDAHLPVSSLSGGNQQRVGLAKWLATRPRVLILDAPTVGVDIKAKDAIYAAVREFADAGMAVILISDEVDEVFDHCERVLVMAEGRIVHSCVPAHSRKKELEEAVYD